MTRFCAKISPTNESDQNAGSLADTPLVDKRATLSTIATTNKKNTRAKRTIHAQNMRTCSFLTFYICLLYSSYLSLHRFLSRESKPTKLTAQVFRCKRQRQKPDFTLQRTICPQSIPTRQVQALFRAAVVLQAINI